MYSAKGWKWGLVEDDWRHWGRSLWMGSVRMRGTPGEGGSGLREKELERNTR